MLGTRSLSDILAEREAISANLLKSLVRQTLNTKSLLKRTNLVQIATDQWGVHVQKVEIKDVKLPIKMQKVMAAEAEATREARSKVLLEQIDEFLDLYNQQP